MGEKMAEKFKIGDLVLMKWTIQKDAAKAGKVVGVAKDRVTVRWPGWSSDSHYQLDVIKPFERVKGETEIETDMLRIRKPKFASGEVVYGGIIGYARITAVQYHIDGEKWCYHLSNMAGVAVEDCLRPLTAEECSRIG